MKWHPDEIYIEAARRGLRLIPRGDKLEVTPKCRLTPDFAAVLRDNKAELLAHLDQHLRQDAGQWLHVAKQILAGEFDGAEDSTLETIAAGLRHVAHPQCQRALAHLQMETTND